MLREGLCPYPPAQLLLDLISSAQNLFTAFYLLFRGSFWGPFGVQNRSCVVPLEILRSILSNDIKFAQIRARTETLWLPEVRVSE